MQCPRCNKPSQVLDSRTDGRAVNRRRKCKACGHRFATEERIVGGTKRATPQKTYKAPEKAKPDSPTKRFSQNRRDDLDDIWDDLSGSSDNLSLRDLGIDR